MNIRAIAYNTFKEAVRNKVFYLLAAFGVIFAMSSRIISMLTLGDEIKVLKDTGLAAIHFFSVLIAVFTGINLVYKEIEKKTIYNILSKPISRAGFILGKFAGLALTLLAALSAMALIFFVFLYFSAGAPDIRMLCYFLLLYMELLIITSISIFFSSFSTPILSSVFTISIYLIGQVLWTFNLFKKHLETPLEKIVSWSVYYILPNLEKFNIKHQVVMQGELKAEQILVPLAYGVAYNIAALSAAILVFHRREFQ